MAKKQKKTSRARALGMRLAGGAKGTAIGTGAGAIAYYGHAALAKNSKTVAENWYAGPLAMVVAGHFAKKKAKMGDVGAALCGAGGYAGAMAYQAQKASKAANAPAADAGAYFDAGAVVDPGDPYLNDNSTSGANAGTDSFAGDASDAMGL